MSRAIGKTVILGAKGMLGSDVVRECEARGIDFEGYDLPQFDITDSRQLAEVLGHADAVINCAAYTNVDGAETETEKAYRVNAEAVEHLGTLARKNGIWVLHISTDFVFDGKLATPYMETDMPNPINAYGRTKLAGEMLLVESRCTHCIIRLEWTYGRNGDHFVRKIIRRAKEQKQLKVVDDQVGAPTATTEAAKIICDVLGARPQGVFHFAASEYASRFDVARFIIEKVKIETELTGCRTADFPTPAARPLNSRFNCAKIRGLLEKSIKPWQVPLEEFLKQL